jgi:hypothetical protein
VERLDRLALARGGPITRTLANEVLAMRRAERGEEPDGAWEGEDEDE